MRWVFLLAVWMLFANTASAGMFGQFMANGVGGGGTLLTDQSGNLITNVSGSVLN